MALIKRSARFAVFERDGFACRYCGRRPPEVVLEVDHLVPKSRGGTNQRTNLVTACFDCNRGKRDHPAPGNIPVFSQPVFPVPDWVPDAYRVTGIKPCKHESLRHVATRWKRTEWGDGFRAVGQCRCCAGPIQPGDRTACRSMELCARCCW